MGTFILYVILYITRGLTWPGYLNVFKLFIYIIHYILYIIFIL